MSQRCSATSTMRAATTAKSPLAQAACWRCLTAARSGAAVSMLVMFKPPCELIAPAVVCRAESTVRRHAHAVIGGAYPSSAAYLPIYGRCRTVDAARPAVDSRMSYALKFAGIGLAFLLVGVLGIVIFDAIWADRTRRGDRDRRRRAAVLRVAPGSESQGVARRPRAHLGADQPPAPTSFEPKDLRPLFRDADPPARRALRERLLLDRVELGLRDRAAVEQLLGLVDLRGCTAAAARGRADVVVHL